LVTVTLTVPAARAAVVAVIEPPLTTATFVAAAPPIETVAPGEKLFPETVMAVPPAVGPEDGETPLTLGAGVVLPFDFGRMVVSLRKAPGAEFR
jgi:hypothetical protein